ncbi:MAG: LptF/LptG family permease, partial [Alphaproteobacteria bacterium]|nr:LptF/LptG family permease [Alphaproteobacteria bacterium]
MWSTLEKSLVILSRTLFVYLSSIYIKNLTIVLAFLTCCISCFNIFDALGRLKAIIIPAHEVLSLSLLKIPTVLSEILPISLLIASLYTLQIILRRQEIVIMLTSGVS